MRQKIKKKSLDFQSGFATLVFVVAVSHLVERGLARSAGVGAQLSRAQHPPHLLHLRLRLPRDSRRHRPAHALLCPAWYGKLLFKFMGVE